MPDFYLTVLLGSDAVPFCHYENPLFHSRKPPEWINSGTLNSIVDYVSKRGISLTVVHGREAPPSAISRILRGVGHAAIVPRSLISDFPGATLVLDSADWEDFTGLPDSDNRTIILRVAASDLERCSTLFLLLIGKFRRLSIQLLGIDKFGPAEIDTYGLELERIAGTLRELYRKKRPIEVNVLTDRLLLQAMHNCDAGVSHLTVAPNGRCYICPAFYYESGADLGAFSPNKDLPLPIPRASLAKAPICTRCDAYHCKRCVYLNEKSTRELSIPSREQCLIGTLERNASKRLLESLETIEPFRRFPAIPAVQYRDPLERLKMTYGSESNEKNG